MILSDMSEGYWPQVTLQDLWPIIFKVGQIDAFVNFLICLFNIYFYNLKALKGIQDYGFRRVL